MPGARPADFGLTERTIDEIRARDQGQARLFARVLTGGCGALWLALTALIYSYAVGRAPILGLAMAPVLGGIGAVIGAPAIAVVGAVVSWLVYPRHPKARALERYETAAAGFRPCDVCRLAQGDTTPKEGVTYCGRCDAFLCPACRRRYDLRAIAALKRGRAPEDGRAG
jgi:hypothetical protein